MDRATDFTAMRKELVELVTLAFRNSESDGTEEDRKQMRILQAITEKASVQQLWRLYRQTLLGTQFKYCPCNPEDHIAITFAGMYVGIEPDGYMHS